MKTAHKKNSQKYQKQKKQINSYHHFIITKLLLVPSCVSLFFFLSRLVLVSFVPPCFSSCFSSLLLVLLLVFFVSCLSACFFSIVVSFRHFRFVNHAFVVPCFSFLSACLFSLRSLIRLAFVFVSCSSCLCRVMPFVLVVLFKSSRRQSEKGEPTNVSCN